jgi:hypothetical protein
MRSRAWSMGGIAFTLAEYLNNGWRGVAQLCGGKG